MLYLYHGTAFRQYDNKTIYPFAMDNEGKPVIFKEYVEAKTPEQAGCFIKKRLRDRYEEPHAKILLNKKYMYVKKK